MAYRIPPAFQPELRLWLGHFLAEGYSEPRAREHAAATVTGVYLRDLDAEQLVGSEESEGDAPRVGFVARPPENPPRALDLPPFRWADVVKLPPTRNAAGALEGQRAVEGEPRPNSPADIGGWRAA